MITLKVKKIHQEKIETVELSLSKGLSIHEKKSQGKVTFYEKKMVNALLRKKFLKKYKLLIQQLYFYLSTDDDSGTAIQEALSEIQKFREELRNKYRKILKEKEINRLEKELQVMEQETYRKQYIIMQLSSLNLQNQQNRSR